MDTKISRSTVQENMKDETKNKLVDNHMWRMRGFCFASILYRFGSRKEIEGSLLYIIYPEFLRGTQVKYLMVVYIHEPRVHKRGLWQRYRIRRLIYRWWSKSHKW